MQLNCGLKIHQLVKPAKANMDKSLLFAPQILYVLSHICLFSIAANSRSALTGSRKRAAGRLLVKSPGQQDKSACGKGKWASFPLITVPSAGPLTTTAAQRPAATVTA